MTGIGNSSKEWDAAVEYASQADYGGSVEALALSNAFHMGGAESGRNFRYQAGRRISCWYGMECQRETTPKECCGTASSFTCCCVIGRASY